MELTKEKQMYDSREKAALDLESGLLDAREEGRVEARVEGEIKLIRTLQEILGEPMSDETSFESHSLEQLQAMAADLRSRVRGRT